MEFVHLEAGNRGRLIFCQIERLPRRQSMSPITRTDVVARTGVESTGRRQEAVDRPDVGAFRLPGEDERLIIRVGQSAAATERPLGVRSKRVVGNRQGCRKRKLRAAQLSYSLLAHANETVHVHHYRVCPGSKVLAVQSLPPL